MWGMKRVESGLIIGFDGFDGFSTFAGLTASKGANFSRKAGDNM